MTKPAANRARTRRGHQWLFTLITAATSAAATAAVTLALTAHQTGDSASAGGAAATYPGHWVDSSTRSTADRATCAGHEQAVALMHEAAALVPANSAGRKAAANRYDHAAAAMDRATTVETHLDLSFAAQTFTAALRTLVVAPTTPEAISAASAAEMTVAVMCTRRVPAASGAAT